MNIQPYHNNAKKHSAEQLFKIACSIRDFGWQQPIVVDGEGVIIVGHGRWFAYEKYKDDMRLVEPWLKVETLLTEEKVKAYRLADNLLASTDYDAEMILEESSQLSLPLQEMIRFEQTGSSKKEDIVDERFINDEGMLAYLNQSIRQVVLHFPQEIFSKLITQCEELNKAYKFETNSDLFKYLVEQAINQKNAKTASN